MEAEASPDEPVPEAVVETEAEEETDAPADEPELVTEPLNLAPAEPAAALLTLEEALQRIPESLQGEMKKLLKADFSQVRRWKPSQS